LPLKLAPALPITLATSESSEAIGMGGKSNNGQATSQPAAIALPADCRIVELPALQQQLRAALTQPSSILDGTAVERIDSAALQLLYAFGRDAGVRGNPPTWAGVSAPLREAADLLGLTQILALPAALPA
jgi:ABC-type transporter Mla MlaB component